MPYQIQKSGTKFCVVRKGGDGKQVACHPTRAKAIMQMRALYAQEGVTGDAWKTIEQEALNMPLKMAQESEEIRSRVQEFLPAVEAVWSDNAEGLPQADVVIIRAGESANRREYPRDAIDDAVRRGFWDNTPMFIDHGEKAMPRKRSFKDLVARVEPGSTYMGQEGEARGRVTFIDPAFAAKVKNAGPLAGLSAVHEFMGQRFRGNDGHMHERVHKFVVNHSLDFVAFPAAGGEVSRFLPAMESEEDVEWDQLTRDMLSEHRPDLVTEIQSAVATEAEGNGDGDEAGDDAKKPQAPKTAASPVPEGTIALEAVERYVDERVERAIEAQKLRESNQIATRAKIREHVTRAALSPKNRDFVEGLFDGQEAYDEAAVQAAIDRQFELLNDRAGTTGPKVKGLGTSLAQESDDTGSGGGTVDTPWKAVEERMKYTPRAGKAN